MKLKLVNKSKIYYKLSGTSNSLFAFLNKNSPLRTDDRHSALFLIASNSFGASRTIKFAGFPSSNPYSSWMQRAYAPL